MKKLLLFLTAVHFLLFLSCTEDAPTEPEHTFANEVSLRIGVEHITRAHTDQYLVTSFSDGDEIGIFAVERSVWGEQAYPSSGSAENYVHNAKWIRSAGEWKPATESDKIIFPHEGILDFYAYYPYVEDADPTNLQYDATSDVYDLMTARQHTVLDNKKPVELIFKHKLVLVQVEVAIPGTRISKTSGIIKDVIVDASIDLSKPDQSDELTTLQKTADIELERDMSSVSLRTLLPAQAITGNRVLFTITSGTEEIDVISRYTQLQGGTAHSFTVVPNSQSNVSTANCFIIEPGEGMVIPIAKAYRMWEQNLDLKSLGDVLTDIISAELIWQDKRGLIPYVGISGAGRNAGLKILTDGSRGEGNAVVGVRINGEIRWSWHIWVTDYDPDTASGQVSNNGYTFMDRNLGALTNATDDAGAIGLYYQWGRKDPFSSLSNWEGDPDEIYDLSGMITYFTMESTDNPVYNFQMSVTNPLVFITGNYIDRTETLDWYDRYDNTWTDRWNQEGSKTMYDPCPDGWKVPVGEFDEHPFHGLIGGYDWDFEHEGTDTEHGALLNSYGYFPHTGARHANDNLIWFFYNTGYLWMGNEVSHHFMATEVQASSVNIGDKYWSMIDWPMNRAHGLPVRCIRP